MKHHQWAITNFKKTYGFDLSLLLHVDWMSDEDSGPEENEMEMNQDATHRECWLCCMYTYLGFHGKLDDLEYVPVLEVVEVFRIHE